MFFIINPSRGNLEKWEKGLSAKEERLQMLMTHWLARGREEGDSFLPRKCAIAVAVERQEHEAQLERRASRRLRMLVTVLSLASETTTPTRVLRRPRSIYASSCCASQAAISCSRITVLMRAMSFLTCLRRVVLSS